MVCGPGAFTLERTSVVDVFICLTSLWCLFHCNLFCLLDLKKKEKAINGSFGHSQMLSSKYLEHSHAFSMQGLLSGNFSALYRKVFCASPSKILHIQGALFLPLLKLLMENNITEWEDHRTASNKVVYWTYHGNPVILQTPALDASLQLCLHYCSLKRKSASLGLLAMLFQMQPGGY